MPTSKSDIIKGRQVTMPDVAGHSLSLRKLHYRQNCRFPASSTWPLKENLCKDKKSWRRSIIEK